MADPIVYPLHKIPNSKVCPFRALSDMFKMIKRGPEEPCFVLKNGSPLTYAQFQRLLKTTLRKAGYESSNYSSHSLRAGGINFADRAGVPHAWLKILGDWRSSAYERYLERPTETRDQAGKLMNKAIMELGL